MPPSGAMVPSEFTRKVWRQLWFAQRNFLPKNDDSMLAGVPHAGQFTTIGTLVPLLEDIDRYTTGELSVAIRKPLHNREFAYFPFRSFGSGRYYPNTRELVHKLHMELIEQTENGLYCRQGGFFIDPHRRVERAIITHAHSDHARRGSASYLVPPDGEQVLKARLGNHLLVDTLEYRESVFINGVKVSLHPAGHILGSCMVRTEFRGEVWVVSGDYKTEADPTCQKMEPLPCDVFITESTFGLPIYRWRPADEVFKTINEWWRRNRNDGRCSVIFGYSLGKAQRLLAGLDPSIGPISVPEATGQFLPIYRQWGVVLPATETLDMQDQEQAIRLKKGGMIIAPSSVTGTALWNNLGEVATANASGWMIVRGSRRRQTAETGFVLSDHADWPELVDGCSTNWGRARPCQGSREILARARAGRLSRPNRFS